jgi:hypothetical protein
MAVDDAPEKNAVFRIEYGRPDATELAALTVVLLTLGAQRSAGARPGRRRRTPWRHMQEYRAPGSWE